jgi:pyruvate kinase
VPILGVTDQRRTWRQMALVWGVQPVFGTGAVTYEGMLDHAREYLIRHHIAKRGQRIVVTAGIPFHVSGTTNMMRVEEV